MYISHFYKSVKLQVFTFYFQAIRKVKEKLTEKYGFCIVDGHRQKINNFTIEPPGLFRGRGNNPKMGMLKKRIQPEDVIINIGK